MTAERQTVWLRGSLERRKKKRFGLCVVPEYPACEKYHSQKERAYAPQIVSGAECLLFLKGKVMKRR